MELNEASKVFIAQMKQMHTVSRIPFCLLDGGFELLWCNDAAREAYPPLAMPRGISIMLEGCSLDDVRDEIASEGRFCLPADPANLFAGHGMLIYAAPPECGALYVLQPQEIKDEGTGRDPQGIMRSIAAFESHYRAPLTAIFSSISLLKSQMERENNDDPALKEYIHRIGHSSMELMRASQMVTDYTRLANGLYPHKLRRVDLTSFLDSLLCRTARELSAGDVPFSYALPAEPVVTVTEEIPLRESLFQLISNGCRFTRPGNRVSLTASRSGDSFTIIVADRGLGIPASVTPRIFEPYYSYSPAGAAFAGNGLGLSIAQEFTALLGGELSFTTIEGQGSSFRMTIPLRDDGSLPLAAFSEADDFDLASAIRVGLSDCIPCETP